MSKAINQASPAADSTVTRSFQVQDLLQTQAKLQDYEARLADKIRLAFKTSNSLSVRYDAARLGFSQVLAQLEQLGIRPVDSRWFRIKAAWYSFTDLNVATQARARAKPCCNRVPRA